MNWLEIALKMLEKNNEFCSREERRKEGTRNG